MTDHVSLALKYRPMRFDDLVGQEQVTGPLSQAVALGRIAPLLLGRLPRRSALADGSPPPEAGSRPPPAILGR